MSGAFRLAEGGRIDRSQAVRFRFDGADFQGFAGDTLASALLAQGVHLMGRSFKYHRPRGVMAAGAEEPNALMRVWREGGPATPNLRAPVVSVFDGLQAESQNRSPSLRWDWGAAADWFAPLLPAGFYYKTFMGPGRAWARLWEPRIRKAAGLGRAPEGADPDHYAHRYAHVDVLVVGAGAAGLAAARAAVAAGARVMLCDEQAEPGGWLLSAPGESVEGRPAWDWVAKTLKGLHQAGVTVLPRTTAFGHFPHNMVGLVQRLTDHLAVPPPGAPRERMWMVRAKEVVFAAGAIERPLVFADNDRPGIMLAGAAESYVARYGVVPGRRAVVVAGDDGAYRAAGVLAAAGVKVAAIADVRAAPEAEVLALAEAAGIAVHAGARVAGTTGRLRVQRVDLALADGRRERFDCDCVLMSGGFTPSVHLHAQARGRTRFDAGLGVPVPDGAVERVRSAGACRGAFGLEAALADGAAAGSSAARGEAWVPGPIGTEGGVVGVPPGTPGGRRFVDFQNDVTDKDLQLALREGFRSIEHVKRYTTTGMATDQGKTSNLNAQAIIAGARGMAPGDVGLTTFRMPYTPVSFGAFAGVGRGALFDPVRETPSHALAAASGAVFEDVGNWKRARYFPRAGESMDAAVARECLAVRQGAGLFDGSTLGKIEVVGPDAAVFLERMYVNPWQKLAPGRCRYGVMLRESGFVMDDGVVGRLAQDRFHVTTTTGGAASVLAVMEDYLQTEWPDLRVWLTSVTEQWAVMAVQGPRARDVVAQVVQGVDLAALPHMGVTEAEILGVKGRLFRVSFTGELGYELNVPARHGAALWTALQEIEGVVPYGTEAMHVLRAEKGYIIVGQESDGTATPDDLGLAWAVGKAKRDFVGRRSIRRAAMQGDGRKQLVGLESAVLLPEGGQIVDPAAPRVPIGHVTSAYHSAVLGRPIALAMVAGGRGRMGGTLACALPGGDAAVQVVSPVFYDPAGERLNG